MADLERSDTVAREPSMRAKTIIIPTVRVRVRAGNETKVIIYDLIFDKISRVYLVIDKFSVVIGPMAALCWR